MQFDLEQLDIPDFRKGLQELKGELEKSLEEDPNAGEDVIPLLTSITRLLKELPDIKSAKDAKSKKFLQCIPDLAFVMQCFNPMMGEGDDEDFDEDYDEELYFAENEDEEEDKPRRR